MGGWLKLGDIDTQTMLQRRCCVAGGVEQALVAGQGIMNALARNVCRLTHQTTPSSAEQIFRERCSARAILCEACVYDLHEAIDVLQEDAERTGLVDMLGQDVLQAIITEAFTRPQHVYRLLIGPVELAAWLAEQSAAERKAIKENLEAKP
jgi:hypothetical protein